MKKNLTIILIVFIAGNLWAQEEQYIFPADAGLLDVTKAPYFADSTGVEDVTEAIQAALDAYPSGNRIIYLPNGTYLISNTLKWPAIEGVTSSAYKRTILQGESKTGTVILLKDTCEGYQDANKRKTMIYTGPSPANRFRNAIRTLTVNTGRGNPGASGIQFHCSNEGTMQHVIIKSGDGQGVYGLDLDFTNEIGPGYIYDLTVEGFDIGIMHGFSINSMVFEKITLRNQNVCGFRNGGNVSTIRELVSENNVGAIQNNTGSATMTLIDAELSGGNEDTPAIYNSGTLYVRNIHRVGYNRTIESVGGFGIDVLETPVKEYISHGVFKLFPSPARSLNLPVKEWPEVAWSDIDQWANVMDYGAAGNGSQDDTRAFQDAIDSGKETVYFPGGYAFKIEDTVRVRGNVKRITGCETKFVGYGGGTIIFEDIIQDTVVFERIDGLRGDVDIVNESSKTLVINSNTGFNITSNGSGDMFLVNSVFSTMALNNPEQHVWARHINTEYNDSTNIVNNGATLWILGYKTERGKTKIHTKNGGKTELLGSHNYSTTGEKTDPWFIIENASMSIAAARETNNNYSPYSEYITEIRGEESKTIDRMQFPRSRAGVIPLYNGYIIEDPLPATPQNVTVTQVALEEWWLDWDVVQDQDIVDYYSVYVSEKAGGPYNMIYNYMTEPGYSYNFQRFDTFYFVVTAVNRDGIESLFSDEAAITIKMPGAPEAPSGLNGVAYEDSIVLSWNSNKEFEFDYYEIYRADPPSSFYLLQQTGIKDSIWTDSSVDAGNEYKYALLAVNNNGDKSSFSDTITILNVVTGNEFISYTRNIVIYPNPVVNTLKIKTDRDMKTCSIVIYNSIGKVEMEKVFSGNTAEIDTRRLETGMYILKITSGDHLEYKKFIISR